MNKISQKQDLFARTVWLGNTVGITYFYKNKHFQVEYKP